jgi:hypothetical protein
MANIQSDVFCDGCGIEITWTPHYIEPSTHHPGTRRGQYCCSDCAGGYRCKCGERLLLEDERRERSSESLPVDLF